MREDWKAGDKAVVVDCRCGGHHSIAPTELSVGAVFTVSGIRPGPFPSCRAPCGLYLAEMPSTHPVGVCSVRFRKIRPDAHEGNVEDWNLILETTKRKVAA